MRHSSRKGSAVLMNQALEKAYNKPAKSSAGIIGFTRRKEAVCKWKLIKHEKAKYQNFMNTVCQMDENDEYSLHYEFSDRITKADKHSVAALMKNVLQRGNPFNLEQPKGIMNITIGAIVENDEEDFPMNCISLGKAARNEFYESRLPEKNIQLLETIRKTRKITKKQCEEKEYDFAKETVKFLRHIDYVRLRDFDLKTLMGYGISPKRGLIQKPNKSELTTELTSMITKNIPTHLPPTDHHRN